MPPHRPVQGSEDLPSDHQEQLREGDVRQGQSQAGAGQGGPPEHEWTRECQQRGELPEMASDSRLCAMCQKAGLRDDDKPIGSLMIADNKDL